jgi:small nuclear ribonucleoprotein
MQKPLQVLQGALGRQVSVELRGRVSYRGVLDGFDPHMNLVLKKAQEFSEGKEKASHEIAILRGDGVIYIST